MPATPSSAEISPSCMAPSPDSDGSSSCSASTRPASRWYWSAWRITPAERTGQPVVREPGGARVGQLGHLGEPLALLAHRDRGHEAGGYARLGPGALAQRAQHRRRVHDRVGVRLREDRAEAAGGGRARAGVDVLLVLATGRAQVHVRVDEGGERVQALGLDDLGAVRRLERRADLGDPAVAHEHVAHAVQPGARVEQARAAHQHRRGRRSRRSRARTAGLGPEPFVGAAAALMRAGAPLSAAAGAADGAPRPASSS